MYKTLAAIFSTLIVLSSLSVSAQVIPNDSTIMYIQLKEVSVVAHVEPVRVVEDTVEYNPAAYRLAEDAMLEDLLRKIPGLEINDGTVMLHGKEVKQLLIDGQRFFGGNVRAGLQNIPAEMVDRVRAYERESDFTRITGIDDGEQEPVLDLNIKKSMMGQWRGNISGGYGLSNRYNAHANANNISDKNQASIIANFNNLNGSISINNASRNQLGGGSSGDAHKREVGFNYSSKSKKLNVDASVHYEGSNRDVIGNVRRENIYSAGTTSYTGDTYTDRVSHVPSADARIEWKPSKEYIFLFKPSLKYTDVRAKSNTTGANFNYSGVLSNSVVNDSDTWDGDLNLSMLFQMTRRFDKQKKGRSLSIQTNPLATYAGDDYIYGYHTDYVSGKFTDRRVHVDNAVVRYQMNVMLSYNEPLGKGFHLQGIVNGLYQPRTSVRDVYDLLNDGAHLDNISHYAGYNWFSLKNTLNMRYIKKKFNVTLGVVLQPQWTILNYDAEDGTPMIKKNTSFDYAPNLSLTYRPDKSSKLSLSYKSNATPPSMFNLIPIGNGTNPLSVHYGNENLLPSFQHKIEAEYNMSNLKRQSSFVCKAFARIVRNQASSVSEYDDLTGITTTVPENINGNWNANGSLAYNKSFGNSFSIVEHASVDYVNAVSYLYDSKIKTTEVNTMRRMMAKESFDAVYRNSVLELTANINADVTLERCLLRPSMNQTPYSFGGGLSANWTLPWEMRLIADFSFMGQRGYVFDELNRNYYVLNAKITQPLFHKRITLTLSANDIFGQLPNLTRVFNASARNISIYNGVNRYVMLSLVYRFKI